MVKSAKELLNCSFDSREFKARAGFVFTEVQQREKRQFLKYLEVLSKDLIYSDIYPPKDFNPKEIIEKIKLLRDKYPRVEELTKTERTSILKSTEIRRLSYILFELNDDTTLFSYSCQLLENSWSNSFFNGILYVYLFFWKDLSDSHKKQLFVILDSRLKNYKGKLRKYVILKDHIHYLDPSKGDGSLALGIYAHKKLATPFEMPSLFGLRENTIGFSFFDHAIYSFYTRKIFDLLDEVSNPLLLSPFYQNLRKVLDRSNSDWVCKMVMSEWIIKSDNYVKINLNLRNLIERAAQDYIGDTQINANWTLKSNNNAEQQKLEQARKILKRWAIQEHISVFFEKCVTDPDRLNFWFKYIDNIDGLKIIGSASLKEMLKLDATIVKTIDSIFIETDSSQSQTAALAMHIDKYIIVEFSDVGAVYVYADTSTYSKFFNKNRINNIRDLKQTQLSYFVTQERGYYYFWEEGRLNHNSGWQNKLDSWLHNMAKTPQY